MNPESLHLTRHRSGAFRALHLVGLILLFAASTALVSGDPLNRFRILIDTNQMNLSEINQMNVDTYNQLAVDGVWAITENHCGLHCGPCVNDGFSQNNPDVPPSVWPNVFMKLNGAAWTISEDEANWFLKEINNNARLAAQSYISPFPVRESLAYYEYFPLLPPGCENNPSTCGPNIDSQQIEAEVPLFGDRIVFLSRNYVERNPIESGEAYWVREGLTAPHAAGVVFEINPGTIINPSPDFNKAVEGINYTLGQGKNCYLLLAPNWDPSFPPSSFPYMHRNNHGGFPDYAADVVEVVTYLNSRGVQLSNPNLFIVLAVYDRDQKPPYPPLCTSTPAPTPAGWLKSSPGFLTGDGTTGYNNSVLAAARALQTYRNSILPQPTFGFLDNVDSSVASGWSLDPETFAGSAEAIAVHLYVDNNIFVGAVAANLPRSDVNAVTGFLGNHGFNVPIPPQYLDGQPHAWSAWAISATGHPALLGNSPMTRTLYDTTPPTVSITAPYSGQNVAGTAFTVTAVAADNRGVIGVQFKLDGNNLGSEDFSPPYSISWNTTSTSAGNHTLTAVARDTLNSTTSTPVTVVVDNTAPTVSVTAPYSGQNVAGTFTLAASASDANMKGVQFQVDGSNVGGLDKTVPYSFAWNTTGVPDGVHTVTAIATDQAGNSTTSGSVNVIVDNTPPSAVFVTAPANGATVSGTITVSGTATDANMKGVQFTVDGGNLGGLDKTVPYSVPWNTVPFPTGLHTLRAVATDQAGNSTTSPAVTVTVNNNSDR